MICMTDGITPRPSISRLPRKMASEGITVSTVALGEDADRQLLSSIAEAGHGRFYETNDPSNVPQIFTKETMEATKSAIKEDLYGTVQVGDHPILAGYHGTDLPFTLGYVMTEAKPTAQLLLAVETGDPLLAIGRYGLGTAWPTRAISQRSGEASGWPGPAAENSGHRRFAALLRKNTAEGLHVATRTAGNDWRLRFDEPHLTASRSTESIGMPSRSTKTARGTIGHS